MKSKIMAVTWMFLLLATVAYSQDVVQETSNAFRTGDTAKLVQVMSDKLQIILNGQQQQLAKDAAGKKLSDFFSRNKPASFSVIHQSQKGTSGYMIGQLKTQSGDFRVHCLIASNANKNKITQIRIEKL